jgi:DNA-binding MarR family transcriptional regulator
MRKLFTFESDEAFLDMPAGQIRVCGILTGGPHTISALSRECGTTMSATTQIAHRLEKAGLVERIEESDDRRVRSLTLTELGAQMMRSRAESRNHKVRQAIDKLGPESREKLIEMLQALIDSATTETEDLTTAPVMEMLERVQE